MQHERGPRNSTIRRQMALYFKEPEMIASIVAPSAALDLALPKAPAESRVPMPGPSPHPSLTHPAYCNALAMSKVCLYLYKFANRFFSKYLYKILIPYNRNASVKI